VSYIFHIIDTQPPSIPVSSRKIHFLRFRLISTSHSRVKLYGPGRPPQVQNRGNCISASMSPCCSGQASCPCSPNGRSRNPGTPISCEVPGWQDADVLYWIVERLNVSYRRTCSVSRTGFGMPIV
jgi:hypothetical protein